MTVFKYVAAIAILASMGCASAPKPVLIPTVAPEKVPLFVVDGNPVQTKIVHVVLDGVSIMDVGWRFSGTSPSSPGFQFPAGVDTFGRMTLFYELSCSDLSGHPIRFIQGYSTESSWAGTADGGWKKVDPKLVRRADLKETIAKYDITSPTGQTRSDYYVYGPRDGRRPYSENTYVYWVEGLDKWFAVKYVRGGPDKE
jgi:hypothetical protein